MSTDQQQKPKDTLGRKALRIGIGLVFGVILPLAVLGGGAYLAYTLMQTAPQAERSKGGAGRAEQARLVEILKLQTSDEQVTVEAMGTVRPARIVSVQPRVGGAITSIARELEPGGVFDEGDEMLSIDTADFELAILQREADVSQARSDLEIEQGQQQVAREEFALLGRSIPDGQQGLVLREPQLARAKAQIAAAEAALKEALLDLDRTKVKAPFNSMVQEENAEVGAIASTSSMIAQLVGTDRFWVELSVPVDMLRWIEIPTMNSGQGSEVRIYDSAAWGADTFRTGYVDRFTATLDEESRMARLLISVSDPLALEEENRGKPPLLLGSYVRAEIAGLTLSDAIAIPRADLHEGDTVWIKDADNRLRIQSVDVAWRGRDEVLVLDGLKSGVDLVTTSLSAPVEGMLLRTDDLTEAPTSTGEESATQAKADDPTTDTVEEDI